MKFWISASTTRSHAPDCLNPNVLAAAGNHVNASSAIREQLKQTWSETDISYIHQLLCSQSQSNECTCCVYVASELNHRGNRFISIQLCSKKPNQEKHFVSRGIGWQHRTDVITFLSVSCNKLLF